MAKSRATKDLMMDAKEIPSKPMMKFMPKKTPPKGVPPKRIPPKDTPHKTMFADGNKEIKKENNKDMSQYDDLGYITKSKK